MGRWGAPWRMTLLLAVLALVQAAHGARDDLPGDAATTAAGARLGADQQLVQTQWSEFDVREEDQPEWRAAHPAAPAVEQHNLSEGRPLGTLDAYQQQQGVAPGAQPYAYPAVPVAAPGAVATGGAVPATLLSPGMQPVLAVQATTATRTLLGVELTTETVVGVGVGAAVTLGLGLWLMAAATTAVALTVKAAACCCCVGCCGGCEAKKNGNGCACYGPCDNEKPCCDDTTFSIFTPCVYCCCPPNCGCCGCPLQECSCDGFDHVHCCCHCCCKGCPCEKGPVLNGFKKESYECPSQTKDKIIVQEDNTDAPKCCCEKNKPKPDGVGGTEQNNGDSDSEKNEPKPHGDGVKKLEPDGDGVKKTEPDGDVTTTVAGNGGAGNGDTAPDKRCENAVAQENNGGICDLCGC